MRDTVRRAAQAAGRTCRAACTALEEKDPDKREAVRSGIGFVGSARRTIAVFAFLVTAFVGLTSDQVWGHWPFAVAFIVSVLALPVGEGMKALREKDPGAMLDRFAEVIGKIRGAGSTEPTRTH